MKAVTPTIKLMVFLSIVIGTASGSISLTAFQTFFVSECQVLTLWASLFIEDIETHAVYNDTGLIVFKQSWSKGNLTETDWMFYSMFLKSYFYYFQIHIETICKELEIKNFSILQYQAGCVAYMEDPKSYFFKVAINGEDTVYLNVTEGVWVAQHNKYSQAIKQIMQQDHITTKSINNILLNNCKKMSQILSVAGKEALSKKSKPEVYFFMTSSKPEAELMCIATGFYPRSINITLWKDKENIMDNVMLTETLPNGDGTYQRTAIVTTGWGQLSSVYCQVEHTSFEEPLVKQINMKHNMVTGLVIGTILGAVICVVVLIWLVRNKKPRAYISIAGRTMNRISWRTSDGDVSVQQ